MATDAPTRRRPRGQRIRKADLLQRALDLGLPVSARSTVAELTKLIDFEERSRASLASTGPTEGSDTEHRSVFREAAALIGKVVAGLAAATTLFGIFHQNYESTLSRRRDHLPRLSDPFAARADR